MEIRELRELSEDYIAEMLTKLGLYKGIRQTSRIMKENVLDYNCLPTHRGLILVL